MDRTCKNCRWLETNGLHCLSLYINLLLEESRNGKTDSKKRYNRAKMYWCSMPDALPKEVEEYIEALQTENKRLEKELKKRKGAAGVLQQIADKLESFTGEQNVWKAIERLRKP